MKRFVYSVLAFCIFSATAMAQTMQHTDNGTQYLMFTHNPGDKIKLNDVISLEVTQKTDKDSLLSTTYAMGHPLQIQVQASQSVTDMMQVFPLLALNDSVLVKVPSDSVYKGHEDKRPSIFPPGSNFNFYIRVVKIEPLDQAMAERNTEMQKIKEAEAVAGAKYIADNKLVVKTTPSGLKYVITKVGLKPKPLAGDTVMINYTGKLLNGQVFDTSIQAVAEQAGLNDPGRTFEPIKFPVGSQQVIPGWDEGLLLLNEGSKATFIIPSSLAYGEQGSPDGSTIPPFSTLVFNVELVSVKRIKHAPVVKKPLHKKHYIIAKKKTS
jgi:FKBP-type peptidyl-prolyl cis-trans isomerase FkpA